MKARARMPQRQRSLLVVASLVLSGVFPAKPVYALHKSPVHDPSDLPQIARAKLAKDVEAVYAAVFEGKPARFPKFDGEPFDSPGSLPPIGNGKAYLQYLVDSPKKVVHDEIRVIVCSSPKSQPTHPDHCYLGHMSGHGFRHILP